MFGLAGLVATAEAHIRRDAQHRLVADFYSVNGLVRATLLESEGQLQVETRRNSIWRFFDNAHATTIQETASDWASGAWAWYIELSIWSLMLDGAHGCLAGPDDALAILVDESVAGGGNPGIRDLLLGAEMIYKFLRHTHLILGLLLFWVVMMYAVSAAKWRTKFVSCRW